MIRTLTNIKLRASTAMTAAVDNGKELSFRELEERSEAIAVFLAREYARGEAVCIWGDKENDMLVFIIACMKSGHPYVVLSSYFPESRVLQITDVIHPCTVLCAAEDPPVIENCRAFLPEDIDRMVTENSRLPAGEENRLKAEDILTYFFTSGSTGLPKCVPATVAAATNMAEGYGVITEKYLEEDLKHIEEKQMISLNIASYAFCSSIDVILNNCGRFGMILYAVSHEQSNEYETLYELIKKANPHTFDCTPQFLSMCLTDPEFNQETLSNLRMLSVGGENLSRRIGLEYFTKFPDVALGNGYGATEMCAGPMWCDVTPELLEKYDVMPIGTPIAGSECFITDEDGNVIAGDGVEGELVVRGNTIAPGYLNDPERTAAVFRIDESGAVCYHTNDIVKRLDGQYFYVGRKDNMVKVGGYRVEIDEVETYISGIEGVIQSAVVPVEKEGRTVMLAAYILMKEKPASVVEGIKKVRKELLGQLQPYMVPQRIKFVTELPYNANGKIDRALLKKQSALS